ncbi:MAG: SDR family NAD(P)-dependent oxidoreductase [Patescibacteria group bacterium]|jgi:NAD(P)-dependent dehydrogenase (short-subunit alcohol dehydrogenase family)
MDNLKELIYSFFFKRPVVEVEAYSLSGKVVIVTGASKGLGYETTKLLLKSGAKVIAVSRDKRELQRVFGTFERSSVLLVEADVRTRAACFSVVQKGLKKFGHIDALVSNAGLFVGGPIESVRADEIENAFATNVFSGISMVQAIASHFKQQKSGSILIVGSRISHNSNVAPNMTIYATSKYAIEGFATALAQEMQPFGVSVSCILPGTMDTKRSIHARNQLPGRSVAQLVLFIVAHPDIMFERVIIRSLFNKA